MKLMEGIVKWQVEEWWNMHTQQVGPDTMKLDWGGEIS
jgi:hypothetical protein